MDIQGDMQQLIAKDLLSPNEQFPPLPSQNAEPKYAETFSSKYSHLKNYQPIELDWKISPKISLK